MSAPSDRLREEAPRQEGCRDPRQVLLPVGSFRNKSPAFTSINASRHLTRKWTSVFSQQPAGAVSCCSAELEDSSPTRTPPLIADMAEVEETLKRIQSQNGVQGIIIVNSEGIPIKTTLDNASTVQYAGLIHQLVMKARSTVRDIDPQNDLTFLRIRSKKNEIMIAPDKDYFLIVIQNPSD
uniref:Dynein, light chain, roadblock-type 1 n=2 Tax=Cyclopterus lumpus TaxID=8103 RepID=A0A8C3AKG7_CYCLU